MLETEKRKGSGLTTGILDAGSTRARIQPMASIVEVVSLLA